MPVTIRVDAAARVRYSAMSGVVTDDELVAAYTELLAAPDFDPTLNDLVDTREVHRVEVTPSGVRGVANVVSQIDRLGVRTRIAIVATRPAVVALARLYALYREQQRAPAEHRVFRNADAARRWLGLARQEDG